MAQAPLDPDEYLALDSGPEVEVRVLGSRFIGQAFACRSAGCAEESLGTVRRRFHDATHHCWAFRLGPPQQAVERAQDDGEPAGTAGLPILGALHRHQVYDALVVVTRYFGGVKLGTGGLARAYGQAAEEAVAAAPSHAVVLETPLLLRCRFADLGTVEGLLARDQGAILHAERRYTPDPEIQLRVRRRRAEALREALIEATAGRVRFEEGAEA